ncbi:MAG: hypothetical protein ABJ327_17985 [Litoreibacter sp.]
MRKNRKKTHKSKKTQAAQVSADVPASANRRAFLTKVGYGIGGVALLGGAGFYAIKTVRSDLDELDLSQIGNGTPAIVQIHDPSCQLCQSLQRATRDALGEFAPDSLQYRVANIRTSEGATFAARFGVPHVTLLLFDGQGDMLRVIQGVQEAAFLQTAFEEHLRADRLGS